MAFVNLQRLMSLNADKGEEMAEKAIGKDGLTAKTEGAARLHAGGLGDGAEMSTSIQQAQERAKGIAAGNGNAFDAAMMGQSAAMQNYQARTKNLSSLMGSANAARESRAKHVAAMTPGAPAQVIRAPESAAERQARLQREQWRKGGYDPKSAEEYAAYSDYIKTGRR